MKTAAIELNTPLVRDSEVITAPLEEEMVMMSLETSSYYALDPVGRRIWDLLDQPTTLAELCASIQAEYDVDDETCRREVVSLVQDMVDEHLVRPAVV